MRPVKLPHKTLWLALILDLGPEHFRYLAFRHLRNRLVRCHPAPSFCRGRFENPAGAKHRLDSACSKCYSIAR